MNTANKAMKNPIRGVVPKPGTTFPYSELSLCKLTLKRLTQGLPLGVSSTKLVAIELIQSILFFSTKFQRGFCVTAGLSLIPTYMSHLLMSQWHIDNRYLISI